MKHYKYDVYESDGTYITTWNDVISEPAFSSSVNSGLSEMKIKLARNSDDFGESDDVDFNNQVIVRCFDTNTNDGVIVFNGFISGYTPDLKAKGESIDVSILGYVQELARVELLDDGNGINTSPSAGNTTLVYENEDPSDIIKDIIDKYNALTGVFGKINYSAGSVDLTGITITKYTFKAVTIADAINKVIQMCPSGWYWYIDSDNLIQIHSFGTTPDHTLYVRRDVEEVAPYKRIENIKNVCYVTGKEVSGANLFRKYDRSASITAYGRSVHFIADNRLEDSATMQKFADAVLDIDDEPEVRTQIKVLDDNNNEGFGKDIETIVPGDVINILNFLSKKTYTLWGTDIWGTGKWGYDISNVTATNLNVVKVDYRPNYVKLEVSSRLPFISNQVNEIRRRLDLKTNENNPAVPS